MKCRKIPQYYERVNAQTSGGMTTTLSRQSTHPHIRMFGSHIANSEITYCTVATIWVGTTFGFPWQHKKWIAMKHTTGDEPLGPTGRVNMCPNYTGCCWDFVKSPTNQYHIKDIVLTAVVPLYQRHRIDCSGTPALPRFTSEQLTTTVINIATLSQPK